MPLALNSIPREPTKALERRKYRSERRLQTERARHVGKELVDLEREERIVKRALHSVEHDIPDPSERAEAISKLVRAVDTLRDRRRILLGEPLPGSRRAGTERRPVLPVSIVDVQPMEQVAAPAPAPMISDAEASAEPLG